MKGINHPWGKDAMCAVKIGFQLFSKEMETLQ
jgi:hypothetical protein